MIFIALGANLPLANGQSPEMTLEAAKAALEARGVKIIKSSRTWLTAPVPVSDQPWYRNAVIEVETHLPALDLLSALHEIEMEFGRIRSVQNAARILDLDLLAYHDQAIVTAHVAIPHPRMHERGFVLHPLYEISPQWIHPILKKSVVEMMADMGIMPVDKPVDSAAA